MNKSKVVITAKKLMKAVENDIEELETSGVVEVKRIMRKVPTVLINLHYHRRVEDSGVPKVPGVSIRANATLSIVCLRTRY